MLGDGEARVDVDGDFKVFGDGFPENVVFGLVVETHLGFTVRVDVLLKVVDDDAYTAEFLDCAFGFFGCGCGIVH